MQLRLEPVTVADLCLELADCPGVREGAEVTIQADPGLLGRVLRDLWAAAHRSPAPEQVSIDVVETESWHEVRVVREGIPISPMIIRALFDPFDANDDATGVTDGLYLARALTVAHGGFLGAEGDDQSTVLFARLPREPVVDPEPEGLGDADEGGETMKYQLSCGDAVPGCSARFEDDSRDVIMEQVLRHARDDHGVTEVSPEMRTAIEGNIVSA